MIRALESVYAHVDQQIMKHVLTNKGVYWYEHTVFNVMHIDGHKNKHRHVVGVCEYTFMGLLLPSTEGAYSR